MFTSMDSISTPCKALAASKNSSVKENKLNRNRGSPARHCKGTSSCYLPTNPFLHFWLCKYRHVRMWEGNLARNSLKCSQLGEDACQRRHIPHTIYATMVHLASSLYFHELVPPWHLLTRTSASSTSKSPRFFHLAPDSFNSIWTSSAGIVEILKVSGIFRTDQLQGLGPQIAGVEFLVSCLWKEIRPTAQVGVCIWVTG